MKKLIFSLIVTFMISGADAMAQRVRLGATAAANLSRLTTDIDQVDESSFFGYRFGLTGEIGITESIRIQPSLLISRKGGDFEFDGESSEFRVSYFEVPVLFDYSKGLGDALRVHILAGPYFAFGMGGSISPSTGNELDIKFGSTDDDDLKPTDFGASIGAGVSIKSLMVSATYNLGLSNISPTDAQEYKNGVFSVGVSYFFLDAGK